MFKWRPYALVVLCLLQFAQISLGQGDTWWQEIGLQRPTLLRSQEVNIGTQNAYYIKVDLQSLQRLLREKPGDDFVLNLPDPTGREWTFTLQAYQMMEAELQAKYPAIQTYKGTAQKDAAHRIHLTITANAWFAAVSNGTQTWFIDPYTRPFNQDYQVYFKEDCTEDHAPTCHIKRPEHNNLITLRAENEKIERRLKTFRLAVSASYTYYRFFGRSIERTMGAIINTINRVNMVYERDLAVRMVLVANNDSLIVTDPTSELFTTESLEGIENQEFTDDKIGVENYDLGHVFDVGNGGYADLGSVCDEDLKARAYTGLGRPQGDAFDIDFVAHEIGHQFSANHSFNGLRGACGSQRTLNTSFEPGSGTTIMSYAGICGLDNIAPNASDYFHGGNIVEMNRFLISGIGRFCGATTTLQNQAPDIVLEPDLKVLPILTPFELRASVSDPEQDTFTANWEQIDPGLGAIIGNYDSGDGPLFRSFPPTNEAYRSFPNQQDLLANTSQSTELLPNNSRELNFQLTVRDQNIGGGGITWDQVKYFVEETAGPFRLENPGLVFAGSNVVFQWDVANTNVDPVGVDSVDLFLSVDGGLNFDQHLGRVLNDGFSAFFIPPNLNTNLARFKLKATDHIFFDISDQNSQIRPVENNEAFIDFIDEIDLFPACADDAITVPFYYNFFSPSDALQIGVNANLSGFNGNIEFLEDNRFNLILTGGNVLNSGIYPVELVINLGENASDTLNFEVDLIGENAISSSTPTAPFDGANDIAIQPVFSWERNGIADLFQVEISEDTSFQNLLFSSPLIEDLSWQLPGALAPETPYFWRVTAINQRCGLRSTSKIQQFSTETVMCKVFTPENLPVAFNAFPFIQSSIEVEEDAILVDVNVLNVSGTYDRFGGIDFRLRSPSGPVLTLLDRQDNCNQGERFSFSIDDEQGVPEVPCPNDQGRILRSETPLSTFNGQNSQGRWTLSIFDNNGNGALETWSLELCFGASSIVNTTTATNLQNTKALIFPNPLHDRVHFQSQKEAIQSVRLFNANGVMLQALQNQRTMSVELPVAGLVPGIYFYQLIFDNGQIQRGKLVK